MVAVLEVKTTPSHTHAFSTSAKPALNLTLFAHCVISFRNVFFRNCLRISAAVTNTERGSCPHVWWSGNLSRVFTCFLSRAKASVCFTNQVLVGSSNSARNLLSKSGIGVCIQQFFNFLKRTIRGLNFSMKLSFSQLLLSLLQLSTMNAFEGRLKSPHLCKSSCLTHLYLSPSFKCGHLEQVQTFVAFKRGRMTHRTA